MDSDQASRRSVLGTLGASGVLALAGCLDDGDGNDLEDEIGDDSSGENETGTAADGPESGTGGETRDTVEADFTIGILQPLSDPLPEYGVQGTAGFYTGLSYEADGDPLPPSAVAEGDYEYSIGGADLTLHVRDTEFDPAKAQNLAEELVASEEVDMLYGVGQSGGAIRVINQIIDRTGIPYIVGPATAAEITTDRGNCRDSVFRANEHAAMDSRASAVYVAEATDVGQMALLGADNAFGQSVVDNYRQVLENRGVDVVFERAVQTGRSEWNGLLQQAEAAGAQGIVGGFTAQTLIPFASSFLRGDYDMQLFDSFDTRVTLGAVGGVLSDLLGENFTTDGLEQANFGPFVTSYHWNQYDNDINDAFVRQHASTYGIFPDLFTSGAFTAASAVVQAFEQAGEVSGDAVIEQMRGMTVTDTPKGENAYTFQEHNNQARSPVTVAPVEVSDERERWPPAIQPGAPVERISGEAAALPVGDVSCDLS